MMLAIQDLELISTSSWPRSSQQLQVAVLQVVLLLSHKPKVELQLQEAIIE